MNLPLSQDRMGTYCTKHGNVNGSLNSKHTGCWSPGGILWRKRIVLQMYINCMENVYIYTLYIHDSLWPRVGVQNVRFWISFLMADLPCQLNWQNHIFTFHFPTRWWSTTISLETYTFIHVTHYNVFCACYKKKSYVI